MRRTGHANLPLHGGHVPRWLFNRMVKLANAITSIIIEEHGSREFLMRLSDPFWFQSFSCILGFDWHSSGTTTTTCAALKSAVRPEEHGIFVAGGKGKASRKTPIELEYAGRFFDIESQDLIRASRLVAKVDNSCIQDSYQLYHHTFIVDENGEWTVIQQGLNNNSGYARRYHWSNQNLEDFIEEPHTGIASPSREKKVLNMTSAKSRSARNISLDIVCEGRLQEYTGQRTLYNYSILEMPSHHEIKFSERDLEVFQRAYELQPRSYEELLLVKGMGPKKIRALALISDLVYGEPPSWEDPVKYTYAHGGKDGHPYPVEKKVYDNTIQFLEDAINDSKLGREDKLKALKSLKAFIPGKQG
ncbi:MAG: DUF763 domain-containing protein [Methanobacteriales archaeon]|nr:DUF763 domain-containing protein [Methanobacteriales archaeon]MBC7118050.1 DUF763 domain-containing protein [Methanobacteriaceae archaeon]